MKRQILGLTVVAVSMLLAAGCSHQHATAATPKGVDAQKAELNSRVQNAADDLNALMNAPDTAIPQYVLSKAKCVAVIPDMIKGGFVIGGKHGRGLVTCRQGVVKATETATNRARSNGTATPGNGWTAPVPITLSGGGWGAQIGVESADVVLVFMYQGAVDDLLKDNVKLSGEAGVAAGPVGRQAEAGTDIKFNSGILGYSRTKGLYAGLTLDGADVRQDMDTTVAMYGHPYHFRRILSGQVETPANAMAFIHAVHRDFQEARTD